MVQPSYKRHCFRFTCNNGYSLIGDITTACQDDNDGDRLGVWSNPRPTCQRMLTVTKVHYDTH